MVERMLWENSTATAIACRTIALSLRKNYVEEVFLFGLLHDLGKLVMMRQIRAEYIKVVEQVGKGRTFIEAEEAILGFGHPLVGALVAKKWNFPPETCQIIKHHHEALPAGLTNLADEKRVIVQLGDLLAHALGYGHPPGYPSQQDALLNTAAFLGISPAALEKLHEETKHVFDDTGAAFM